MTDCVGGHLVPPDIEFLVTGPGQQEERFRCHRSQLVQASPVFRKQFSGGELFAAQVSRKMIQIRIQDCNPKAFKKMLEFIYDPMSCNDTKFMDIAEVEVMKLILETLHLGRRLQIGSLVDHCLNLVQKSFLVTEKNYRKVQRLKLENFGTDVEQELTDKFQSLVWKVVSRDQFNFSRFDSSVSRREIVRFEVEGFKAGLVSKVLEDYNRILQECKVSSLGEQAEAAEPSLVKEYGRKQAGHEDDIEVLSIFPSPGKSETMRTLGKLTEAGALVGHRALSQFQAGLARPRASEFEMKELRSPQFSPLRQQDEWRQWSAEELRRNVIELERQEAAMLGLLGTQQPQQLPDITSLPSDIKISKEDLSRILQEVQSNDGSDVHGESELRVAQSIIHIMV